MTPLDGMTVRMTAGTARHAAALRFGAEISEGRRRSVA